MTPATDTPCLEPSSSSPSLADEELLKELLALPGAPDGFPVDALRRELDFCIGAQPISLHNHQAARPGFLENAVVVWRRERDGREEYGTHRAAVHSLGRVSLNVGHYGLTRDTAAADAEARGAF